MTADSGNFVAKNDKKRKTKDEMNPALIIKSDQKPKTKNGMNETNIS